MYHGLLKMCYSIAGGTLHKLKVYVGLNTELHYGFGDGFTTNAVCAKRNNTMDTQHGVTLHCRVPLLGRFISITTSSTEYIQIRLCDVKVI